ncbi:MULTISPECIES: acylneuraminate cytidylyltransferase family protein [unclassified Sphingomonas]|uniref:acylneuraminate cytidylyltransferase family protein n=1 Tax=unclassified Sphingomonas TaxID=196159 RepID=UPI0006F6864C|nr:MULTISPECIES: acylneuraminate cytidylyltransferase family protein [unclassified Sphingomonas]KQX19537.1 hypothetical protein ASD17_13565 [Sphingomonas sp. Root1294]KQY65738.1 hypothetical protein ASD39_16765 [Sphingomonas sp. Root50]KRB94957.1 hypothetical protein ASE22_03290 [Sphingomonas sp. Root720]
MIGIIPVRAGSKGLPGKNVRPLLGKPLYRHAVDQALRTLDGCVISTDIPEILSSGDLPERCRIVKRPEDLAADDTPMAPVIAHAIDMLADATDIVVLLQATSPLRSDADIRAAVELHRHGGFDLTMSVTRAESSILKYGYIEDGKFVAVSHPEYCFTNRQKLPAVYRPNGAIYVISVPAFRRYGGLAMPEIGAFEMPAERSGDIDILSDFVLMENLMRANGATDSGVR